MTTAITAVFISATATATDYPTRIRALSDLGVRVKNKAHVTLPSGGFVTLMLG